jgi:hypothetical protein
VLINVDRDAAFESEVTKLEETTTLLDTALLSAAAVNVDNEAALLSEVTRLDDTTTLLETALESAVAVSVDREAAALVTAEMPELAPTLSPALSTAELAALAATLVAALAPAEAPLTESAYAFTLFAFGMLYAVASDISSMISYVGLPPIVTHLSPVVAIYALSLII